MMRILLTSVLLAAASLVPVGTFGLDDQQSRVEFHVRDNRGGFTGVARDIDARISVREQGDEFTGAVEVRIDARTMTTGIAVRDRQMRRDFLATDRFPRIVFRGTATPRARPGALAFPAVLRGDLTIKDVTKEVEIPLRVTALADSYLAEGQVTVRMSDFEIPIPRFLVFVAEDPVQVSLKVRLVSR
jgi:polyisoprenoid-binding protein YceI